MTENIKKFLFITFGILLVLPITNVSAYSSDIWSGSGGVSSSVTSEKGKIPGWSNGEHAAGIRMTVVDRNGKMLSGTHTADFVNFTSIKGAGVYMNSSSNRHKGGVIDGNLSWKKDPNLTILKSPANIVFHTQTGVRVGGKTMAEYFTKLARTDTLYNKWITKTGYNRDNYTNYNQHYILVEPTLVVVADGKVYYGTATELAKLIQDNSRCSGSAEGTCGWNLSLVAHQHLGPSACYGGSYLTGGKKNNNVTLDKGDTLVAYAKSQFLKGGQCQDYKKDKNLYTKQGGKYNGNGVGIFYMSEMIKNQCDINNPDHFHDPSDDYKSNDKTATCCQEMINKYGEEYVVSRYPICGACEVNTDSETNACGNGTTQAVHLTDVSDYDDINQKFKCLYQGVSGKSANKYDYSARESVRQKYKVLSLGSNYCEVYCVDDVVANFPGNFLGLVSPGGTFQWPSFNDDYEATVTRTRTCKIRFRQQEWLSAYNNGNSSQKSKLLENLKSCAIDNLNAVVNNYNKIKNPSLAVSYNNGVSNIGPKTLKLSDDESNTSSTCSNCSINVSGINTSNVVSQLSNLATQIGNKVLTITQNLKYVLPDGLYQYVDNNQGGKYLETYNPNNGSLSVKKTDSSNLLVSEEAKPGNKYDLIISYESLSPVSGKFSTNSGKYVCEYTPSKSNIPNTCDVNEINHFKDLNGDGKLDSGPNGEDCCEWVADKFGKDSDAYQDLVEKGLCPVTPPGDPDDPDNPDDGSGCSYPKDLQSADFATKKKCCSMVLVDQSIDDAQRKAFYEQYCTGDPYCPQDCEDGVCHDSPMTQNLRNCMNGGKSYNECKVDNCPGGGSIVIYRPISLLYEEAFPGVEDENRIVSNNNWYYYSNWAYRGGGTKLKDYYVKRDITNNRGVEEYELYNMDPMHIMYIIDLDADTIGKVRSYNRKHSYDDFTLECKDGRQCKSTFLRKSDITSKISGCGMSTNWYACQGISKDRGD